MRSNELTVQDVVDMNPAGIVLSPGPGRPEEAGICIDLVQAMPHHPMLGVCLGHQCLANAYGGKTIRSGEPTHGRASSCIHDEDPMFEGVSSPFQVGRYHSLTVKVPESMLVTATTLQGEVMGMRHLVNPHFGLQFHPESLLTPHGLQLITTFVKTCEAHATSLLD